MSDEELLLLRLMTSDKEVDDMLACPPCRMDQRRHAGSILGSFTDLVAQSSRASAVRVTSPGYSIQLSRSDWT